MTPLRTLLGCALACLGLAGCLRFEPTGAFPCTSDTQCAAGHRCEERVCRAVGAEPAPRCGNGFSCPREREGGCGIDPVCVDSSPPSCDYAQTVDGASCTLPTDPVGVASGHCDSGHCLQCLGALHCPLGSSCIAGTCQNQLPAIACLSDADCTSNQCECVDALCQSRVCATANCSCRHGPSGQCLEALGDGIRDPGDCDAPDEQCQGGTCVGVGTGGCTADSECGAGECECTDATCAVRACAPASCSCKYGPGGACATPLNTGVDDPGDCAGASSCYAGACLLDAGQPCTSNTQCGTGQCECADASCAARVCAPQSCTCGYSAQGGCTNALASGTSDPGDCDGIGRCAGGACALVDGSSCGADAQCVSGACECADASCSARKCAAVSCTCRYLSPTGTCGSYLTAFVSDPEDCDGTLACSGDGRCAARGGESCANDSECAGTCECADKLCFTRRCSPVNCSPCHFNGNSDGACDGATDPGATDAFCSSGTCAADGNCAVQIGDACNSDAQCASQRCACWDATCTVQRCAVDECTCMFSNATGCSGPIAAGHDPDDTCGFASACNGNSACAGTSGASCAWDSDCVSAQCECAEASCSYRECSLVNCPCQYNYDGDSSCDGLVSAGSPNAQRSCICSGTWSDPGGGGSGTCQ